MFPNPLLAGRRAAEAAETVALLPARARRMATADVEPTPYEEVHAENTVRLRRYESDADRRRDTPVVFAYALINTPAVLDLCHDRSVVGQFLDRGFDVYVVDWGAPSRLDAHLSIDDYVVRYLANCVDAARDRSATDAVHLVGCSVGALLAAAYAALFPGRVATLGLQGPPLDFDAEGGMLDFRELAVQSDPRRLVDALGTVPAELVDLGFAMRKPVEYAVQRPLEAWERLDEEEYLVRGARIARWAFDGPDVAGETYRQFVEDLLVENKLVENRLSLLERPVDLENVTMPVALILGETDAFVPRDASLPFLDAVPSDDTHVFDFPTGHVGTFVDRAAHAEWWPRVCDWFAKRTPRP